VGEVEVADLVLVVEGDEQSPVPDRDVTRHGGVSLPDKIEPDGPAARGQRIARAAQMNRPPELLSVTHPRRLNRKRPTPASPFRAILWHTGNQFPTPGNERAPPSSTRAKP
jgi:hypothetical protein